MPHTRLRQSCVRRLCGRGACFTYFRLKRSSGLSPDAHQRLYKPPRCRLGPNSVAGTHGSILLRRLTSVRRRPLRALYHGRRDRSLSARRFSRLWPLPKPQSFSQSPGVQSGSALVGPWPPKLWSFGRRSGRTTANKKLPSRWRTA